MPNIYLSPSTQEFNQTAVGQSEEYFMNLIADAMEPYLRSSGIKFTRNTPDMTAASSIRQSNEGNYDLHVAIHSNAAPEALSGKLRGTDVYYYPTSSKGKRASDIMVKNFKNIYPDPSLVRALTTTRLGEVSKTRAPSTFLEVAYHDNLEDAEWIVNNIELIGKTIVLALTQYFGIPFIEPQKPRKGTVTITSGYLNIRSKPNTSAPIIGRAYKGQTVIIYGETQGWYVVEVNNVVGYASSRFITVL